MKNPLIPDEILYIKWPLDPKLPTAEARRLHVLSRGRRPTHDHLRYFEKRDSTATEDQACFKSGNSGLADSVFCTFLEELLLHIRVCRIYNIGETHFVAEGSAGSTNCRTVDAAEESLCA